MCVVFYSCVLPLTCLLLTYVHVCCLLLMPFTVDCLLLTYMHVCCLLLTRFTVDCFLLTYMHVCCLLLTRFTVDLSFTHLYACVLSFTHAFYY